MEHNKLDNLWEECNLFDCLVDMCEFLETSKIDHNPVKSDLIDSCLMRCHFMIKKAISHPSTTSMSLSGWKLGLAEM